LEEAISFKTLCKVKHVISGQQLGVFIQNLHSEIHGGVHPEVEAASSGHKSPKPEEKKMRSKSSGDRRHRSREGSSRSRRGTERGSRRESPPEEEENLSGEQEESEEEEHGRL